jgi:hypothetical protein
MAKRKPRIKIDLRDASNEINIFKKKAKDEAAGVLRDETLKAIRRGVSPVKGFGRFEPYSETYKTAIKKKRYPNKRRIRPINMTLTGEMLKSIFVKIKKNSVIIGFDNKLADIHNRLGAGKSKVVRRLLPTNEGERFSRKITTELSKVLTKVAREIFKG